MRVKTVLLIDALVNLALGILLLLFKFVAEPLGVPASDGSFYPNILGAVLAGIAMALAIEAFGKEKGKFTGLGLMGAIGINLCGGLVLVLWLIFGRLDLPVRGSIFLWTLAIILLAISSVELIMNRKKA